MLKTNRKGRAASLFQTLFTAILLGGAALNSGSAQAAGWSSNGPPITGYMCNLNDLLCFNPATPVDSPLVDNTYVTLLERSTTVGVNTDVVEFTQDPGDPDTPWHLTLDFNPNRGIDLNDFGFLKYKITITDPSKYFDQVKLGNTSTITNGLYILTTTFWDSTFTSQVPTSSLNNPPTPKGISVISLQAQTLYVKDEWNVQTGSDGTVDNFQNSFGQTDIPPAPAPLPLVGIGAAFGFSRRLRSRINGARLDGR